jgi:hypothetical protein
MRGGGRVEGQVGKSKSARRISGRSIPELESQWVARVLSSSDAWAVERCISTIKGNCKDISDTYAWVQHSYMPCVILYLSLLPRHYFPF